MNTRKILLMLFILLAFISLSFSNSNNMSVVFVNDVCLIPQVDNRFKTCDNMIVKINDKYHVVPNGFITDLASIPRFLWPIFSPGDYNTIAPAVLHDWHYCCTKGIGRLQSDLIFYSGLRELGMNYFKANLYYYAVRVGGYNYYKDGDGILEHQYQFADNELHGIYDYIKN